MPETKPLLCGYHARVAWAKHLANTVVEEADRKAIADALDGLIRFNDLAAPWNTMDVHLRAAANRALEGFYELLRGLGPAGGAFLTYFKTTWEPKVGEPLASHPSPSPYPTSPHKSAFGSPCPPPPHTHTHTCPCTGSRCAAVCEFPSGCMALQVFDGCT